MYCNHQQPACFTSITMSRTAIAYHPLHSTSIITTHARRRRSVVTLLSLQTSLTSNIFVQIHVLYVERVAVEYLLVSPKGQTVKACTRDTSIDIIFVRTSYAHTLLHINKSTTTHSKRSAQNRCSTLDVFIAHKHLYHQPTTATKSY